MIIGSPFVKLDLRHGSLKHLTHEESLCCHTLTKSKAKVQRTASKAMAPHLLVIQTSLSKLGVRY
jgi:hypothetical protein